MRTWVWWGLKVSVLGQPGQEILLDVLLGYTQECGKCWMCSWERERIGDEAMGVTRETGKAMGGTGAQLHGEGQHLRALRKASSGCDTIHPYKLQHQHQG